MSQSRENDDDELQTVHPLPSDDIGQETKTELADDSASGGGDLDRRVRTGGNYSGLGLCVVPKDDAQHRRHHVDGEDVVRIGEETDPGHDDGADMVPTKGSLVYFGQSKTASLVGVGDMSVIIVEVVEGGISA